MKKHCIISFYYICNIDGEIHFVLQPYSIAQRDKGERFNHVYCNGLRTYIFSKTKDDVSKNLNKLKRDALKFCKKCRKEVKETMTNDELIKYVEDWKAETSNFLFNLNQHQITMMDKRAEINKIVKRREAFVFFLLYYTIPHVIPLINTLVNDLQKLIDIAKEHGKKKNGNATKAKE